MENFEHIRAQQNDRFTDDVSKCLTGDVCILIDLRWLLLLNCPYEHESAFFSDEGSTSDTIN